MSWDMVPGKNSEGYPDPTAATALSNIQRSQRGLQSKRAGEHFENLIAASLNWYKDKGVAYVEKTPEPIPAKGRQGLWNWAALLLRHKGRDSWDRPVYEDESGKLWKDVEPRADKAPKLCNALYNAFDGEPDTPMEYMSKYEGVPVVFLPERDTWTW